MLSQMNYGIIQRLHDVWYCNQLCRSSCDNLAVFYEPDIKEICKNIKQSHSFLTFFPIGKYSYFHKKVMLTYNRFIIVILKAIYKYNI